MPILLTLVPLVVAVFLFVRTCTLRG